MATKFWTSGHTSTGWASSSSPCRFNEKPKTLDEIIVELEWQIKEEEYFVTKTQIDDLLSEYYDKEKEVIEKILYLKLKT